MQQAGVASGMALVASNQFLQHKQLLLSIFISAIIFFKILGSFVTRYSMK